MRRLVGPAVSAVVTIAAVAACSFSAGSSVAVDKNDLSRKIAQQVGGAPESVECPDDLKGEVGATTRCTLDDAGETYGVDVTVTKVDGTDVQFDLKVDDKPS
jgi:hypothetical protein